MHGTGKSWTAADTIAWWIDSHPVGQAFAVSTAPTGAQVEAILWRELGAAHAQVDLKGHIAHGGYPKWMIGKEMVAYGRKPTDYADPIKAMQSFQGIHAKYVLVVLDEACGIPKWLWDAVDTLATNDLSRVLAIGNPDDPASQFETVCRPGSGWNVVHIGVEHLPWRTGEVVPEYLTDVLTGPQWVEERKLRWGEESPLYKSKVLGLFPDISDDTLISPAAMRVAHAVDLAGVDKGQYGMDVARLGKDETVIYRSRGGVVRFVKGWHKTDTMTSTGKAKIILDQHMGAVPMWVDVNGLGAGVFDRGKEQGLPMYPFNAGEAAHDKVRFGNRRAEVYWEFAERLAAGEVDLDPQDDILASQLQSIKWKTDSRGKIFMESKDDMRKRGLPSPDRADAAVMADLPAPTLLDEDDYIDDDSLTGDLMARGF